MWTQLKYSDLTLFLPIIAERPRDLTRTSMLQIARLEKRRFKLGKLKSLIWEKNASVEKMKGSQGWTEISNSKKTESLLEGMCTMPARKTKEDPHSILSVYATIKTTKAPGSETLTMMRWCELCAEVRFWIRKITANITYSQVFRDLLFLFHIITSTTQLQMQVPPWWVQATANANCHQAREAIIFSDDEK